MNNYVGQNKIIENSEMELKNGGFYFKDIKSYIHIYKDSIIYIDLENALKIGKICIRKSINFDNFKNDNSMIITLLNSGIDTFKKLFISIKLDFILEINEMFKMYMTELKSINVFTPFAELKKIKNPVKWKISNVWKAILSGQIKVGIKKAHYTDDYAFDAYDNFGKGKSIDLLDLAKNLIEHSSGWWISKEYEKNGIIKLGVNCHSFDYNQIEFKI
ncbi:MAG: hypothetical protein ACM3O3_13085 [Syntrophothermus sp.]